MTTADHELLNLAAKAIGLYVKYPVENTDGDLLGLKVKPHRQAGRGTAILWNALKDDGDRLRLARRLGIGISIDFADCCAWKRLPGGDLVQEFWGGDCGDEAHAVLRAATEIAKRMPKTT